MLRSMNHVILAAAIAPIFGQAVNVNLRGTITDSAGAPIAAATVKLVTTGTTATSGADGTFALTSGSTGILRSDAGAPKGRIQGGSLYLSLAEKSAVTITAYGLRGEVMAKTERTFAEGSHSLDLPGAGSGIGFFKLAAGGHETVLKALSLGGSSRGAISAGAGSSPSRPALAKQSATAAALYDVVMVTKSGYQNAYLSIANSDSSGIRIKMLKDSAPKFSFFVTSLKAMVEFSGKPEGFGGDFRYGETGPGAGLRGADKLCAAIAEKSMPGSSVKGWRAFLSVTSDASGQQVNAIDRVGPGPWYDRTGRMVAPTKADLVAVRPRNGDPTIMNDLPNEDGVPNHRPDPTKPADDNHHTLTGSNASGTLQSATSTCKDWTVADGATANGKPMTGFSWPRTIGGTGSGSNWITGFAAYGCAPGVQITQTGAGDPSKPTVGEGGGYGGYYCFALTP